MNYWYRVNSVGERQSKNHCGSDGAVNFMTAGTFVNAREFFNLKSCIRNQIA